MNASCQDLERILRDAVPEERAALDEHAKTCAACAGELRAWNQLSAAARELHEEWDSPALWPAIERHLKEEAARAGQAGRFRGWLNAWIPFSPGWQVTAAAALTVLLAVSGAFLLHSRRDRFHPDKSNALLRHDAVQEADRAEAAYLAALDKLAEEARPQLEDPSTPLLAGYREKLQLLDGAIRDLRAEAGLNPSNAYLRRQLLAMYQEKQQTLEEVLEMKR